MSEKPSSREQMIATRRIMELLTPKAQFMCAGVSFVADTTRAGGARRHSRYGELTHASRYSLAKPDSEMLGIGCRDL